MLWFAAKVNFAAAHSAGRSMPTPVFSVRDPSGSEEMYGALWSIRDPCWWYCWLGKIVSCSFLKLVLSVGAVSAHVCVIASWAVYHSLHWTNTASCASQAAVKGDPDAAQAGMWDVTTGLALLKLAAGKGDPSATDLTFPDVSPPALSRGISKFWQSTGLEYAESCLVEPSLSDAESLGWLGRCRADLSFTARDP